MFNMLFLLYPKPKVAKSIEDECFDMSINVQPDGPFMKASFSALPTLKTMFKECFWMAVGIG